jgi:hypothetical protein
VSFIHFEELLLNAEKHSSKNILIFAREELFLLQNNSFSAQAIKLLIVVKLLFENSSIHALSLNPLASAICV